MSAESSQLKPPTVDAADMVRRKLAEAELAGLDTQIRTFDVTRDKLTAGGQDSVAFYRRIDARRTTLLGDLKSAPPGGAPVQVPGKLAAMTPLPAFSQSLLTRPIAAARFDPGLGVFGLGTTGYVQAGVLVDDQSILPQGPYPVSGDITDVPGAPPGSVMFNGILNVGPPEIDTGQYDPAVAYYWLRTWQLLVPFPPPTTLSTLTYQFEVSAIVSLFTEGIGQLMSFVSLGETADLTQGVSIPVNIDGGWPLNYDLSQPTPPTIGTYNGHYGFVQGQTTVQRTFEVGAGNVPAVAIVLGVAVGLPMQSQVDLYFAGAGYSAVGITSENGSGSRITYSYEPQLVFQP